MTEKTKIVELTGVITENVITEIKPCGKIYAKSMLKVKNENIPILAINRANRLKGLKEGTFIKIKGIENGGKIIISELTVVG